MSTITECARQCPAIIIATTYADGREYAEAHPDLSTAKRLIVTLRNSSHVLGPMTGRVHSATPARGRLGPVFATPAAKEHDFYEAMLADCIPCGIICTCYGDDSKRVA